MNNPVTCDKAIEIALEHFKECSECQKKIENVPSLLNTLFSPLIGKSIMRMMKNKGYNSITEFLQSLKGS